MLAAAAGLFVVTQEGRNMTGTITKRAGRDGKPTWGYSFFVGRIAARKRIQITQSGFESRKRQGRHFSWLSNSTEPDQRQ
jgi:hypothetical protein